MLISVVNINRTTAIMSACKPDKAASLLAEQLNVIDWIYK